MYEDIKERVCVANKALVAHGLVNLTFGNASAVDRAKGVMAIKPSGVAYANLTPCEIVVLSIADGRIVEGSLRPSSDTPTHLALYRAFETVGGIVHTHSSYATGFAQAGRPLPCLGTTHADHFFGEVPVARALTPDETAEDYEANIGRAIIERFAGLDPLKMPAVLAAGHGPFAWGATVEAAVENAAALEIIAQNTLITLTINPAASPLPPHILNKHFQRKHGPDAYYGQKQPDSR